MPLSPPCTHTVSIWRCESPVLDARNSEPSLFGDAEVLREERVLHISVSVSFVVFAGDPIQCSCVHAKPASTTLYATLYAFIYAIPIYVHAALDRSLIIIHTLPKPSRTPSTPRQTFQVQVRNGPFLLRPHCHPLTPHIAINHSSEPERWHNPAHSRHSTNAPILPNDRGPTPPPLAMRPVV